MTKEEGMLKNKNSPFYGRFRLDFVQVFPFRELTYGCVILKVNDIEKTKPIYQSFPIYLKSNIHLYHQKNVRGNDIIQVVCFEDSDWFLCLDMINDKALISMSNFYFGIQELSEYIENCHFYIYSSGDLDTRWLDEYIIENGNMTFVRNIINHSTYFGVVIHFLKKALIINTEEYKRFSIFQVYNLFFSEYQLKENNKNDYDYEIDKIEDYIKMMSKDELTDFKTLLKEVSNLELNTNLRINIDKIYNFNELWKVPKN